MDKRPADTVFHDLDALFRLGVVAAMSDEQLLERFTAQTESDGEIAFEAIVRRHGPMVMGVCRHCWATSTTPRMRSRRPSSYSRSGQEPSARGNHWVPGCMESRQGSAGEQGW